MPIPLRPDCDGPQVLAEARRSKDGPQARRLLAMAAIYDGASRTEAARISGVTLQIVRDWVMEFNARGPGGLIDRVEAFLNGTMAATRRNRNTGRWEDVCTIGRSDMAFVRSLSDCFRVQHVAVRILVVQTHLGLWKEPPHTRRCRARSCVSEIVLLP
jgi:hypothetical protein